jgi:hypothetical protein
MDFSYSHRRIVPKSLTVADFKISPQEIHMFFPIFGLKIGQFPKGLIYQDDRHKSSHFML